MDHGEISIGCETAVRAFIYKGKIMFHAFPVGLFIQTENHPDCLLRYIATIMKGFHRIKRSDDRSLVVHGAPSADEAVRYLTAVGLEVPVVSFRDHIQMSDDAQDSVALSTKVDVTAKMISIKAGKTGLASLCLHVFPCLLDSIAKRVRATRPNCDTGYRDKTGQSICHLCPVLFDLLFYLFQVDAAHLTELLLRLQPRDSFLSGCVLQRP